MESCSKVESSKWGNPSVRGCGWTFGAKLEGAGAPSRCGWTARKGEKFTTPSGPMVNPYAWVILKEERSERWDLSFYLDLTRPFKTWNQGSHN